MTVPSPENRPTPKDRWKDASSYERFMGRWSRALARELVTRLRVPPEARWLEIGCGTGALTSAICELARPAHVLACDVTPEYVHYCRERLRHPELAVVQAQPGVLPASDAPFDVVVSSLVLNFLPSPIEALRQMRESCATGGRVVACVWDYSEGMEFLRNFWDVAGALDSRAVPLHEGSRFPICRRPALRTAFETAGLGTVEVAPLEIATAFSSFDDYWAPFVDGPGPAPTYLSTLPESDRQRLRDRLRETLAERHDGRIELSARAWVASGVRSSG
jgi:SAM-dependent methyltransferase